MNNCKICQRDQDVFILPICNHSLCKSCAQQKIFNQVITQQDLGLLVCPICKTQIKIQHLQNTIDKESYLKIYQLKIERNKVFGIKLNEDVIQCFQCAELFQVNIKEDLKHVLCEFCYTVICLNCNRQFHESIPCLQAIQQYVDAIEAQQNLPQKQEIKIEAQDEPANHQIQQENQKIVKPNIQEIQIQPKQNQKLQIRKKQINQKTEGSMEMLGNLVNKVIEAHQKNKKLDDEPETPTFEKKQKLKIQENQEKVEPQQPLEKCIICFDPVANIKLQICAHSFCQPCLNEYLQEMVIKPKYLDQLMCPSCRTKLQIESVQQYVDKKVFDKISDMILESGQIYGIGIDDALVKCLKCETCFLVNKGLEDVKCYNCGIKICRKCNKLYHPKMTCEQAAKISTDEESMRFQQFAQVKGWIKCPKCNQTIERYKGCNFMRCESSQCKRRTFFCFLCRQLLTSNDHYNHFKKNNPYENDCIITLRKKKDFQIQGEESTQEITGNIQQEGTQNQQQAPGQEQIQEVKQQNQQNEQQQIQQQKQVQELQKPNQQSVGQQVDDQKLEQFQEQQQIVEQAKPKPIIKKNPIIRKIPTNLQSDPNFGPPQAEYNCFVLDMLTQFCRNCANELEACSSNIRKCQKCNTQYCNKCFSQIFSNHIC